jgi:hypothetical protein
MSDASSHKEDPPSLLYSVVFTWGGYGPCMTAFCGTYGTYTGAWERIEQLERDNSPFPTARAISVRPMDGDFHVFPVRLDTPAVTVAGDSGQCDEAPAEAERRDSVMRAATTLKP